MKIKLNLTKEDIYLISYCFGISEVADPKKKKVIDILDKKITRQIKENN